MKASLNHNLFFSSDVEGTFLSQFLNKELLQKKIKAFSAHLLLSALFISTFFLVAILYWYPHNSLELSGIKNILFIIVIADLILGPALTFMVFNPKKKSLKFDLGAVLLLQFSMFCYGIYTVYVAHPIYITFTVDRFTLVSARDASPENSDIAEYKVSKLSKPTFAYVESPKDREERNQLLFSSVRGGLDLEALSQYYLPYHENISNIIAKGWDKDKIFRSQEQKNILSNFLKKENIALDDLAFIPAEGKAKFMTYAVSRETGKPIKAFEIDPWETE